MPLVVPFSREVLLTQIEKLLVKGKDKLSDLFVIIRNDLDAEFDKELDDAFVRELRLNLKTQEFRKKCATAEENVVFNFDKFECDIEKNVDTKYIKIFFCRDAPKNAILSKRVFSYPQMRASARPFQTINDKPSFLVDKYGKKTN